MAMVLLTICQPQHDVAGASPALTAPLAKAAEILAAQEDPGLPAAPVAPAVTLPVEELC